MEIDGLVKNRGIHHLPAGTKIKDILAKSGGLRGDLSINSELLEQKIEEIGHTYIAGQENKEGNVPIKPISPKKLAALSLP
ncbi:MAG: hypothetical protein N3A64_04185, partial [Desulfobacterota bacterium]|nr:hypothetical protein [Thermodesulfobacteriota bacterium]